MHRIPTIGLNIVIVFPRLRETRLLWRDGSRRERRNGLRSARSTTIERASRDALDPKSARFFFVFLFAPLTCRRHAGSRFHVVTNFVTSRKKHFRRVANRFFTVTNGAAGDRNGKCIHDDVCRSTSPQC